MRKRMCVLVAFCLSFLLLNSCGIPTDRIADISTEPEDYYIRYHSELYTLYYKEDYRINHRWEDLGDLAPQKEKAVCVGADDPSEVLYNCKIRTYENDPEHLFILECGNILFEDRLLRKASADFPDYLAEDAPINHIILKQFSEVGEEKFYAAIEDSDRIDELMRTIRAAVHNRNCLQTISVDKTSDRYGCYVGFDGIIGNLYVGFLQKGTDGRWGFSAYEIDYNSFSDGYGLFPLPQELQYIATATY